MISTPTAKVLGARDGKTGQLRGMGVRFMVDAAESGGSFSLVEHPMEPRALGAPMHRHSREDEYSYVLEGRISAQLGDELVYAQAGDLIFKPRGQWHTFWNPGEEPARILEIISPGGFERYFERVSELFATGGMPDPAALEAIASDHGLDIDVASIPRLMAEHGLR
jgi:mannose-6-phosphate isomerase-like protein (cupin superfamily)